MAANSIGVVDDSGHIDVTPNISPTTYTAWTRGELVFLRAPARQIVADLGRAYGADIRVADSALAHHLITWSIPVEQVTLAGALDVLTATLNAHVVRSGNTLTIVPGRTSSAYPRNRDSLTKPERMYGR